MQYRLKTSKVLNHDYPPLVSWEMSLATSSAGWNTCYYVPKPSNKREQQNSQQQQLSSSYSPSIKTPINSGQSSSEYYLPKGRYNYKKSDVIYWLSKRDTHG
jgi:hypothetical protein